jgi:hypothetical protein
MTPADVRQLLDICGLSNREAADILTGGDDRRIRRWKSGEEAPSPEQADRMIGLAGDTLADQAVRALNLAAGGRVEAARLTVRAEAVRLEGEEHFNPLTRLKLRAAFAGRLLAKGLRIDKSEP